MKNIVLSLIFLLSTFNLFGQVVYTELPDASNNKRQLKIQLPRNYEKNTEDLYPVIVVFDGDYLFEPVAGIVDYYSYWDDMPDAIVVGINQKDFKLDDFMCDELNGLPSDSGAEFFEFVTFDLFKFLDNNYRTTPFRTIVGHGDSANFLNFYLYQDVPFFNAYISLSPRFTPKMELRLKEQFDVIETDIFYTLATSSEDRKSSRNSIGALHKTLNSISNEMFHYNYSYFENKSHYELVNHAIPGALEHIFMQYKPITKKEYKEDILGYSEGSAYDYLVNKYETILNLYGIDKKIRLNDFNAAEAALKKNEKWDGFELLGKLAKKQYPESMLGLYYTGVYYEKIGEPKKAMKAYQSAYIMEEIGNLKKDDMLHYAEMIKADFGFK